MNRSETDQMVPPMAAAFNHALNCERLRNARLITVLRLVGVTLFLALLIEDQLTNHTRQGARIQILAPFWVLSLIVFIGGRFSPRLLRLSSTAIPVMDVPLVLLVQASVLNGSLDPRAVTNFTLALYIVLVMLGAASLHGSVILLTLITATSAELWLQFVAQEPVFGRAAGVLLIGLAAGLSEYARRRRLEMVDRVCSEQLLRERLGRYFSPKVAEHIQKQADAFAAGQDCEVTVLFADLCGFTALSETIGSARTVALLNEFQARMVEAVFAAGGTLDKYIGDGLMAYFGAPLTQQDHAQRALACAVAMQQALADLNQRRIQKGEGPLRMRIGIHSGQAVVGSIGAPHRREFTVIGDTVNVASRLEQVAKLVDEEIVISEQTRCRVGDAFVCKPLEAVAVKGKTAPLSIFAPTLRLGANSETALQPIPNPLPNH